MPNELLIELHYLGGVDYFSSLLKAETVCFECQEHYTKGSFRNRMHIATPQGIMRLSIPLVKGKNSQMAIRDVQIAYDENWQLQHWRGIQAAYGKSPFFEFYQEELHPFYQQKTKYLFDWNWALHNWITETIGLEHETSFSTEYTTPNTHKNDQRNQFHPKSEIRSSSPISKPYSQVFEDKTGFLPNLSIIDLLFCAGPEARMYLVTS